MYLLALDCQSQVFQEIDTSGDGILQLDEFVAGIEKVPLLRRPPWSSAMLPANRAPFASQLPGLDKLIVDGERLSSKPQPPSFLGSSFQACESESRAAGTRSLWTFQRSWT